MCTERASFCSFRRFSMFPRCQYSFVRTGSRLSRTVTIVPNLGTFCQHALALAVDHARPRRMRTTRPFFMGSDKKIKGNGDQDTGSGGRAALRGGGGGPPRGRDSRHLSGTAPTSPAGAPGRPGRRRTPDTSPPPYRRRTPRARSAAYSSSSPTLPPPSTILRPPTPAPPRRRPGGRRTGLPQTGEEGAGIPQQVVLRQHPVPVSNPLPGVRMNCTSAPGVSSLSTGLPSASRSPRRETRLGGHHAGRRRNAQPVAEHRLELPPARVPTHQQCAMQNQDSPC